MRERILDGPGGADAGSAVIEFVVLGTLLLVPVVYFILSLGAVQAGSFAVVGAADQAAKTIALSEDPASAGGAAEAAAATTMGDFGFDRSAWTVDVACSAPGCEGAGARVTVRVRLTVPLPLAPAVGGSTLSAAAVESSSTEILGRYR
ncbi:hypothetical protein GCM10011512_12650 [Tersicoccus solisilvae]|uniref:Pilus assembly protein TadE n=1 Tax=Tersicoccus solisilvae TaxID=1882339 RepID=A0ABQ1NYY9_9MICC|nr:hypothetical protein GCM10011512_12650 [Tersicoccus solisilvae]